MCGGGGRGRGAGAWNFSAGNLKFFSFRIVFALIVMKKFLVSKK